MKNKYRTIYCGEVSTKNIGEEIKVAGWLEQKRNLGSLVFMTLRDETGVIQLISEDIDSFKDITRESTMTVTGVVRHRAEGMTNPNMKTGEVEVLVSSFEVLGVAQNVLPFEINRSTEAFEDTRLKYRYLDLRNPKVHDRILFRTEVLDYMRKIMKEMNFTEIQTPIITASSPEGARDFIVPSRKYKGKFYALPQAPQIFKQLLMCSGFNRYFQIAPCFRDEDPRSDRLYGEFYQLDLEMSFATDEDVYAVGERIFYDIFTHFSDKEVSERPFRRIPFKEAMLKYGSDKPDLRFDMPLYNVSEVFANTEFKVFENCLNEGGIIQAMNVKNGADKFSRKQLDKLQDYVKVYGAKALANLKLTAEGFAGSVTKVLSDAEKEALRTMLNIEENDIVFFVADKKKVAQSSLGALRVKLGHDLDLINKDAYEFLWVTDFPMFEYDENENRYVAAHHPFTSPNLEDVDKLLSDPAHCYSRAYDLVLNGYELLSGSIRIHDQKLQEKVFEAIGMTLEEAHEKFSWFMDAFQYGTPPHGGVGIGLERLTMILAGTDNIRDVVAFPKTASASDLMAQAPSPVDPAQLKELGIETK